MNRAVWVDPPSNFHPYECDGAGKCVHCDREYRLEVNSLEQEREHNPATCALCDPSYDGMPNPVWRGPT